MLCTPALVLAALGAVTFVFQYGQLTGIFGIARPGSLLSFLPIILFGLAMYYEVFLESRMREESQHEDATATADAFVIPMTVIPRQHIPEKPDDRRAR